MEKFVWDDVFTNRFDAGSKSRNDVSKILQSDLGFVRYRIFHSSNVFKKIYFLFFNVLRFCFFAKKNSVHAVNFPVYLSEYLIMKLFKKILKLKFVCIVHDIDSFRGESGVDKEIKELCLFDSFVCNNEIIADWIRNNVRRNALVTVFGFWPYVINGNSPIGNDGVFTAGKKSVYICGNLSIEKAGYVYKLDGADFDYKIYGKRFEKKYATQLAVESYRGFFDPNSPRDILLDGYGLVWDGPELDTCSGLYGRYLEINVSHKNSFYIAMGLPLIVWEKSAVANVVRELGIGLCVDSLRKLNSTELDRKFEELQRRVANIRPDILSGKKFAEAVRQALPT